MKKKLIYRQAEWKDEKIIANFYVDGYGNNAVYKYPERFNWLYKNNPYIKESYFLPIWIALDEDKIVGMSTLMLQEFCVEGNKIFGAWCSDLRILPDYRRMGIATQLERLRQKNTNVFSVTSSNISIELKKKIGYSSKIAFNKLILLKKFDQVKIYDDFSRYIRINQNKLLYNIGKNLCIGKIISKIIVSAFWLKRKKIEKTKSISNVVFKKVNRFSNEVDRLWEQIRNNYGLTAIRDKNYLNWKYSDQPHMNYEKYIVQVKNEIKGVLILRKTNKVGIISEIYNIGNNFLIDKMINFAIKTLSESKVNFILVSNSIDKELKAFYNHGFVLLKKNKGVFSLSKEFSNKKNLIEKKEWLISYGDHDLDEAGNSHQPSLLELVKTLFNNK